MALPLPERELQKFNEEEAQVYLKYITADPQTKSRYLRQYINLYLTPMGRKVYAQHFIKRDFIGNLLSISPHDPALIADYRKLLDADFKITPLEVTKQESPGEFIKFLIDELCLSWNQKRDREHHLSKAMILSEFLMDRQGQSYLSTLPSKNDLNNLYLAMIHQGQLHELMPYYIAIFEPDRQSQSWFKLVGK